MGFRDRFYTARTARAILSWRLAIGAGVGVATAVAGLGLAVSIGVGVGVYVALVTAAMPRSPDPPRLDPFTVGEPWRQLVQGAQRAATAIHRTVDGVQPGPLRQRLDSIVERLDHGLAEAYAVATRGHDIDGGIRRLDPTALRSKLATLEQQRDEQNSDDDDETVDAAIESVRHQLDTVARLEAQSADAARRLRLTRTRLDELVARTTEVSLGAGDTEAFEHDVDDLVVELEGLRLAIEETNRPGGR